MATKPTKLRDEELLPKVLAKAENSCSWFDSKLSKERERVTKYLNGTLPKRNNEGSATYVSSDVYDSVEMMRAVLLETFAGGDNIAQFDPDQFMNAEDCRVATEYASYVIFRENEGYNIFNSAIYDGLTARAGIAKVYWEEKFSYSEEQFEALSHDDAYALAAQDDVDEFEATEDPATGLYSGTLTRKYDKSRVAIDSIAPEEFLIEPLATSVDTANYCGHRTPKTKAELIDMGYRKELVSELKADEAKELQFSPEVLARREQTQENNSGDPIQDKLEYVVYYESYVRMEIDSAKGVRLYKICHAGGKILDKQEVDRPPFIAFIPLPIPHVFYGNNFAARVIPTQNARTVLFRGVLDHTSITNNPRYLVVNGGLMNPREMLDNRLGGLVNVRRPDSVTPMQQSALNPYVFNTLSMLTENNEKSTGISALSQGLNKDAVSTQNSQGLVDNLMKASGQREKIIARNFAYNFLVPLMLEVIRLTILNEKKEKVVEVAGKPLTITANKWTERTTCTVSFHLGYGDKDMAVSKLATAYERMAKDAGLGTMFGPAQRYEMWHDMAKLAGFSRFSSYLARPDQSPPPQPDPLKTKELEIKDKLAEASVIGAQAKLQTGSQTVALAAAKLEQGEADLKLRAMEADRTHDRQDIDTAGRVYAKEGELEIKDKLADIEDRKVTVQAKARNEPASPSSS